MDKHDDCDHENVIVLNRNSVKCKDCGMDFRPHSDVDYYLLKKIHELLIRIEALEHQESDPKSKMIDLLDRMPRSSSG